MQIIEKVEDLIQIEKILNSVKTELASRNFKNPKK